MGSRSVSISHPRWGDVLRGTQANMSSGAPCSGQELGALATGGDAPALTDPSALQSWLELSAGMQTLPAPGCSQSKVWPWESHGKQVQGQECGTGEWADSPHGMAAGGRILLGFFLFGVKNKLRSRGGAGQVLWPSLVCVEILRRLQRQRRRGLVGPECPRLSKLWGGGESSWRRVCIQGQKPTQPPATWP